MSKTRGQSVYFANWKKKYKFRTQKLVKLLLFLRKL